VVYLFLAAIRHKLENQENLSLFQQAVEDLIIENDVIKGVKTTVS
jgi:tRNA uridine 5-carboxymethylaminomethyl modification enzyme